MRRTRPSHRRHDRNYVAGPKGFRRGNLTVMSAVEILKDLYPQSRIGGGVSRERSWAAKLARDRHWITSEQYFAEPLVLVHRERKLGLLLAPSPLFAMLKKTATPSPEPEATMP